MMFKELLPKYDLVHDFVTQYRPRSLIDYGCARGRLLERIRADFDFVTHCAGYDPNNAQFDKMPTESFDVLVSCDVIEHFEPDNLDVNLQQMQSLFDRAAFLLIACYPAKKRLADGRNAHLVIETAEWWLNRCSTVFDQCCVVNAESVLYHGKPELRLTLEKSTSEVG